MIEELIEILRRSRRSCSVAEVVSGGTDGSGPISCMAGWFYGKPGEPWPTNDRGIMIPLLQIDFAQVSNVPDCLQGISLLTMFLDRTRLPKHGYADSGDDWLLRAYEPSDVLVPLQAPPELWAGVYPRQRRHFAFNKQFPPRVTRLSWRPSDEDYPGWTDVFRSPDGWRMSWDCY